MAPDSSGAPLLHADDSIESQRTLSLLRDQVDALQVQAAERQRPWFKQPSAVLSVVALVVSLTFSLLSAYFHSADTAAASLASTAALVRANLSSLVDLQLQQQDAAARVSNDPIALAGINGAINLKRQMLIEETERLMGQLSGHATSAEYLGLGRSEEHTSELQS